MCVIVLTVDALVISPKIPTQREKEKALERETKTTERERER